MEITVLPEFSHERQSIKCKFCTESVTQVAHDYNYHKMIYTCNNIDCVDKSRKLVLVYESNPDYEHLD